MSRKAFDIPWNTVSGSLLQLQLGLNATILKGYLNAVTSVKVNKTTSDQEHQQFQL